MLRRLRLYIVRYYLLSYVACLLETRCNLRLLNKIEEIRHSDATLIVLQTKIVTDEILHSNV